MKKQFVKIIASILMAAVFLVTLNVTTADAADAESVIVYELNGDTSIVPSGDTIPTNKITPRYDAIPTRHHPLAGNPYYYWLDDVTDYTNTRYYYNPDDNGVISISTENLDSGGKNIIISLNVIIIDGALAEPVHSWTGNPQSIQGLGFPGLDPAKNYFFSFGVGEASKITGHGYIHHPADSIPHN